MDRYSCADPRYRIKKSTDPDSAAAPSIAATCMWNAEDWDIKPVDLACVRK